MMATLRSFTILKEPSPHCAGGRVSPSRSEMLHPHHKGVQGEYMYNPTISSELDAEQWLTSGTSWFICLSGAP
jgi:hypothetical protein